MQMITVLLLSVSVLERKNNRQKHTCISEMLSIDRILSDNNTRMSDL